MEQVKGTVNRVELVGWVGAEPEQRFLPSGTAVCNFRVATKRFAGRNEAGERTVETDWTPIEAWDKLAETCARYLHTRSWEDRESGQKRFKTIVRADEVLFLDARERGQDEDEAVEEVVAELPF